jgi:hypothetical protein
MKNQLDEALERERKQLIQPRVKEDPHEKRQFVRQMYLYVTYMMYLYVTYMMYLYVTYMIYLLVYIAC